MGIAVVLFYLKERGESERREGRMETLPPPPGLAPGPRGGPPLLSLRSPGGTLSTNYAPKSQKCTSGLQNTPFSSVYGNILALGDFGVKKCAKSEKCTFTVLDLRNRPVRR